MRVRTSSLPLCALLLFACAAPPPPGEPRPGVEHAAAARDALRALVASGGEPSLAEQAELVAVHPLRGTPEGRGGALVHLRQQLGGVEVYGGDLKLLLGADGALLHRSGQPATTRVRRREGFRLRGGDALALALAQHFGVSLPAAFIAADGDAPATGGYLRHRSAAGGPLVVHEARSKPVYFSEPGGALRPAYFVEFFASRTGEARYDGFRYLIAAEDGAVLLRSDLRAADSFRYRVFAESTGDLRPLDGPIQDMTPYPAAKPDGRKPGFITPTLVQVEGLNRNPNGAADPWLPAGASESRGNNVDAFADRAPPEGFSPGDLRAALSGPGAFDRSYDPLKEPGSSDAQVMASVTQVFYDVNWHHDDWYGAGFNEAAGNAQQDNFGRGGVGGDPILAAAQDNYAGGARNNASMYTPADGMSPRLQLYLWSAAERARKLTIPALGANSSSAMGVADFGPPSFDLTGALVLGDDGDGLTSDGCQSLRNNVAGKIVLVDAYNCKYKVKALNAQAAGAAGLLVGSNISDPTPPFMANDSTMTTLVTIPLASVNLATNDALKTALRAGAVTVTMSRSSEAERDGALDNLVVAHEWGHYLHYRLSGCDRSVQCYALSEGWADFNALLMAARPGDDLRGAYTTAMYAAGALPDAAYFGNRRFPYSVDPTKNALRFRHMQDGELLPTDTPAHYGAAPNYEIHNAGEVFASMLWEGYVALQQSGATTGRSFAELRRLMQRYIVVGLQLTPRDATLTETRDALLAATAATADEKGKGDAALLAAAFARRGAGSCATSPPRDSVDLRGVVESDAVRPRLVLGAIALDDSVNSCDGDGILDPGERGALGVVVNNRGAAPLSDGVLRLRPGAGLLLEKTNVPVPQVPPYGSVTVQISARLADGAAGPAVVIDAMLESQSACEPSVAVRAVVAIAADDRDKAAASDDAECPRSFSAVWKRGGDGADAVWSRTVDEGGGHAYRGVALARKSDTVLVTPPLNLSASDPFIVRLQHRYRFESDGRGFPPIYYDGAVIEISEDDGATWVDVDRSAAPGYTGWINNGNVLAGRRGFVAESAGYPARRPLRLDFGQRFAGKTVRLRFRLAMDELGGDFGWELDDFVFSGLRDTPFSARVPDAGHCPAAAPDLGGSTPDLGATPMRAPGGCAMTALGAASAGTGASPVILLLGLLTAFRPRWGRRSDRDRGRGDRRS